MFLVTAQKKFKVTCLCKMFLLLHVICAESQLLSFENVGNTGCTQEETQLLQKKDISRKLALLAAPCSFFCLLQKLCLEKMNSREGERERVCKL